MALDYIDTANATKIPTLTRTDGAPASGTVEVPESVASFDDGSQQPTRVSASNPLPVLATGKAASGATVSGNPVLIGGSDGTNARNLLTDTLGNLIFTGKNLVVGPTTLSATGTLIAATDVGDASHASAQFTGTYTGVTLVFEQSDDNTTWVATFGTRTDTFPNAWVSTVANPTANSIYFFPLVGRYFRIRVSAYSTGSITGTAEFGSGPFMPPFQPVAMYGLNASGTQTQPTLRALNSDNLGIGSDNCIEVASSPLFYNGSTNDRQRGNHEVTVLASAARTTTQTSADLINYNGKKLKIILDVTSAGTGSVTVTINGKSTLSSKYYLLLAGAAVTTNSTNVYTIFPGATATANVSANDCVPLIFQVVVTANNTNSVTYSVDAQIML